MRRGSAGMKKAISKEIAFQRNLELECLDVLGLPALRSLGHVELHGLTLLQAAETARLDRRKMHKNVFAILTADEAVTLGVIKPLYCSLFCHVGTSVPFNQFTLERLGDTEGRLLAVEAKASYYRFGLTHTAIVRGLPRIGNPIRAQSRIYGNQWEPGPGMLPIRRRTNLLER